MKHFNKPESKISSKLKEFMDSLPKDYRPTLPDDEKDLDIMDMIRKRQQVYDHSQYRTGHNDGIGKVVDLLLKLSSEDAATLVTLLAVAHQMDSDYEDYDDDDDNL